MQSDNKKIVEFFKDFGAFKMIIFYIQLHPELNTDTHHNNFALLFLDGSFDETLEHISPICLPEPCSVIKARDQAELNKHLWKRHLQDDQNCVSHGWGKDQFGAKGS